MNAQVKTFAKILGQFEAIHCWKDAPPCVAFLRHPHRHMFFVTVWIQQQHDNRDIEYYICKKMLQSFLDNVMEKPQEFSCEMYAKRILNHLFDKYGQREIRVEVTEDGHEGAVVEYSNDSKSTQ